MEKRRWILETNTTSSHKNYKTIPANSIASTYSQTMTFKTIFAVLQG
jgi:hypothetical protein